jgi:hypothetical protein
MFELNDLLSLILLYLFIILIYLFLLTRKNILKERAIIEIFYLVLLVVIFYFL